jgi:hypothetical protein
MAIHVSHLHRLQLQTNDGILLTQGRDARDREFFAYIRITLDGLHKVGNYQRAGQRMNLLDLGELLMAGFGLEPSTEVKNHMETQYNFRHPAAG